MKWKVSKHGHIWYQPAVRAMLDMYEREKRKTHGKSFTNVCTSIRLVFVIRTERFLIKGSGSSALAHSIDFTKFDFYVRCLFLQTVVTVIL